MKQIHKRRLLRLATFLREKVPDEHFDLNRFTHSGDYSNARHVKDLPLIASGKQHGCGTTACAIGWCPAVFPKSWEWCRWTLNGGGVRLKGGGRFDDTFEHAEQFFGLSKSEVSYLFHPFDYPSFRPITRLHVADRIEKFVARGGMPKSRSRA